MVPESISKDRKDDITNLYCNLKIGLEDVVNGNTRPFSEFLSETKTEDKKSHKRHFEDKDTVSKYICL